MNEQMINLKCRKCGAPVTMEQKKCEKCGAPVFLKIMMEEEKRHLSAKEIREKDKRMRREYKKLSAKRSKRLQKEEKMQQDAELEAAEVDAPETAVEEETERKSIPVALIVSIILVIIIAAASVLLLTLPDNSADSTPAGKTITLTPKPAPTDEPEEASSEIPAEETPEEIAEESAEEQAEEAVQEAPQEEEKPDKQPSPAQTAAKNDYLFPSDAKKLTESDLAGLSKQEVGLIRNEIYARKGYIFKSESYKSYFSSKDWYKPTTESTDLPMNSTETYNINFILEYERSQGWR